MKAFDVPSRSVHRKNKFFTVSVCPQCKKPLRIFVGSYLQLMCVNERCNENIAYRIKKYRGLTTEEIE